MYVLTLNFLQFPPPAMIKHLLHHKMTKNIVSPINVPTTMGMMKITASFRNGMDASASTSARYPFRKAYNSGAQPFSAKGHFPTSQTLRGPNKEDDQGYVRWTHAKAYEELRIACAVKHRVHLNLRVIEKGTQSTSIITILLPLQLSTEPVVTHASKLTIIQMLTRRCSEKPN